MVGFWVFTDPDFSALHTFLMNALASSGEPIKGLIVGRVVSSEPTNPKCNESCVTKAYYTYLDLHQTISASFINLICPA